MAKVGDVRPGTEVCHLAEDAVADVGEVADVRPGHDDAVLDLHRVADVDVRPEVGVAADVGVRPDRRRLAYVCGAVDDDTGLDGRAGFDHHGSSEGGVVADVALDVGVEVGEFPLVRFEELPRAADVEPPVERDGSDVVLVTDGGEDVREFELAAFAGVDVQERLGLGGEDVGTGVDQVRWRVRGFLDDARDAVAVEFEDAVLARVVDAVRADCWPRVVEPSKRGGVVERVAVQDDERRVVERGARGADGVRGAALLGLLDVRHRDVPVGVAEVRLDGLGLVANDEHQTGGTGLDGRVEGVGDDRLAGDREHRLGSAVGEGPHPGSLPRREHDSLHTYASTRRELAVTGPSASSFAIGAVSKRGREDVHGSRGRRVRLRSDCHVRGMLRYGSRI